MYVHVTCGDGRWTDLAEDEANCGACGAVCAGYEHCAGGECHPVSKSGMLLANPATCDGERVDLAIDWRDRWAPVGEVCKVE